MTRIRRYFFIAAGTSLVLLVAAGAAGWFWLKSSLPQVSGTIATGAVTGKVDILRDENGVPHIFAANDEDAYVALGYVHAQDRLWQMEMTRRLGAGRLSEIFGEATVPIDRYSRTFGLYRLAEAQVEGELRDARGVARLVVEVRVVDPCKPRRVDNPQTSARAARAELVHFVEHQHAIVRSCLAQGLDDVARKRTDVSAAMAPYLGLVVGAAETHPRKLSPGRLSDALTQ